MEGMKWFEISIPQIFWCLSSNLGGNKGMVLQTLSYFTREINSMKMYCFFEFFHLLPVCSGMSNFYQGFNSTQNFMPATGLGLCYEFH